MTDLVDHLAELTGFRDRDMLDLTLVGALRDVLGPVSVALYRPVGEPGNERWTTRAFFGAGDAVATADPAWVELDGLPPLASHPARHEAYLRQCVVVRAGDATHVAMFPVATDRQVIGVVEIETAAALDTQARQLVGGILRIFRNFLVLLDYSERDTLTGLLNRKTFDDSFMKTATPGPAEAEPRRGAAHRAADERRGMGSSAGHWLGLIDIDHFKRVNDDFGHMIGDEVLLLMARLMRSSFRFHDRLYRFGGEEFLVLLRGSAGDDARRAFERLRRNTEQFAFPQVGRITVSIGFTEVRFGDTPTSAFERADKAVYFGKANGRNQVQSHADLVARGLLVLDDKPSDVELF